MREAQRLHIDGEWTTPVDGTVQELTDPATGRPSDRVVLGGSGDADRAARAARQASPGFSTAVATDLGFPIESSRPAGSRRPASVHHAAEPLGHMDFVDRCGSTWVRREPIGMFALPTARRRRPGVRLVARAVTRS